MHPERLFPKNPGPLREGPPERDLFCFFRVIRAIAVPTGRAR